MEGGANSADAGEDVYKVMGELEDGVENTAIQEGGNVADTADTTNSHPNTPRFNPAALSVPALTGGAAPGSAGAGMFTGHGTGGDLHGGSHTDATSPPALEYKEQVNMDTDTISVLPNLYYQSRTAKDATFSDTACVITGSEQLGSAIGGEMPRVGSFEKTAADMGLCFTGTRVRRGPTETQQNGSFSFDPATMTCICCEKPHPVFSPGETTCICIADQNFPANLSGAGTDKMCIATIRIESASLLELVEIFFEIFADIKIPAGTTICMGSATHLHRTGPTIYATDWVAVNRDISARISGVNVCPLAPIISDTFPGSLAISLASLTAWFASVYANGNRGLLPVWADASRIACESAMTVNCNPDEKIFIVHAFPAALHPGAKLIPRRIAVMGSCRGQAPAPPAKANEELTGLLLSHLNTEYLIGYSPGQNPVRTGKNPQQATGKVRTAILYGNSNIRQCAPALQALGYTIIDRTELRWDGSDSAAEAIRQDIGSHTGKEDAAFVFDFLSPVAYRFRQSDGGLALPVKLAGGFHLLGEATIADDGKIREWVKRLGPVLQRMSCRPTVLIPPLPRFVFGGCCRAKNHAIGSGSETAAKEMIGNIAHLRKVAKTELQKMGAENWWLADTLSALGGGGCRKL